MAKHIGIAHILDELVDRACNAEADIIVGVYVGAKRNVCACALEELRETIVRCVRGEITKTNDEPIILLAFFEDGKFVHIVYPESKFEWVMKDVKSGEWLGNDFILRT